MKKILKKTLLTFAALVLLASPASATPKVRVPTGTLTLVGTSPVTFTAEVSRYQRQTGHVWVSMSCYDETGTRTYYGEELERDGVYVLDDTVWVLWIGSTPSGRCFAFLLFHDDRQTGESVLDTVGFFDVP